MIDSIAALWLSQPEWLRTSLIAVAQILAVTITVILCVAYTTLAERKVIGFMQVRIGPNRVGPFGLLQPFADVIKMLLKEVVVPSRSNRFPVRDGADLTLVPAFAVWAVMSLSDTGFVIAESTRACSTSSR
jgi:NADH-quinone oxidoreductase subunit H